MVEYIKQRIVLGEEGIRCSDQYNHYSVRDISVIGFVNGNPDLEIVLGDSVEIRRRGRRVARGLPRYVEGHKLLLTPDLSRLEGDDLNDAPAVCNTCMGSIHSGMAVKLEVGDVIHLQKNPYSRKGFAQEIEYQRTFSAWSPQEYLVI